MLEQVYGWKKEYANKMCQTENIYFVDEVGDYLKEYHRFFPIKKQSGSNEK